MFSQRLKARRSFLRGYKPAKHIMLMAERAHLSIDSICGRPRGTMEPRLWNAVRNEFRKMRNSLHGKTDKDGVASILFQFEQSDFSQYIVKSKNVTNYDKANPMIIFLSHKDVIANYLLFGKNVLGLDATFNITQYEVSLHAIMGRYNGGGIPLAYFIASSKSEIAVTEGLLFFKEILVAHIPEYVDPLAIVIDKDEAELNAIKNVFPGLCCKNVLVCTA